MMIGYWLIVKRISYGPGSNAIHETICERILGGDKGSTRFSKCLRYKLVYTFTTTLYKRKQTVSQLQKRFLQKTISDDMAQGAFWMAMYWLLMLDAKWMVVGELGSQVLGEGGAPGPGTEPPSPKPQAMSHKPLAMSDETSSSKHRESSMKQASSTPCSRLQVSTIIIR